MYLTGAGDLKAAHGNADRRRDGNCHIAWRKICGDLNRHFDHRGETEVGAHFNLPNAQHDFRPDEVFSAELERRRTAGRDRGGGHSLETRAHLLDRPPLHRQGKVGRTILKHRDDPVLVNRIDDASGFILEDFLGCGGNQSAFNGEEEEKEDEEW